MVVKGRTVKHCKGGGVIKRHKTRTAALKQHRAIMAGKKKK